MVTEFNQRPGEVKAMCEQDPVFITERGHRAFVLMSLADYEQLRSKPEHGSLRRPVGVKR